MRILKAKKPRESKIEAYFVEQVEALGGKASKFVSPGEVSQPDRIVAFRGEGVFLVEVKRPGGKPRSAKQVAKATEWEHHGVQVFCVATKPDVDRLLKGRGWGYGLGSLA